MLLLLLLLLVDSLNAVINCFLGTKGFCKSKARVICGRGCCTIPDAKKHREKTPIPYTAQPHHHLLNSSHHHNTTTPNRRHILDNLYPCQLGLVPQID